MTFDPNRPFNNLPGLPPAAETESKPILRSCIAANVALAELNGVRQLVPNQGILMNSIPILEAQASSQIEGIVTTAERMFLHARDRGQRADPATTEALRCHTALNRGLEMLIDRPVTTVLAVEVCRAIKAVDLDIRSSPGTRIVNAATSQVIYTPPEGEEVLRGKLANWERYIHETEEVDPLIRLAVIHYQFEAIHPFIDGNGRTGRVLNLLYLVDKGLLGIPVLYLSRHIIQNQALYYRLLLGVTTGERWEEWILFMLEAVRAGAKWTTATINAVRDLLDDSLLAIQARLPKTYSRELVELLFLHPYCRIGDVVEAGIAKRQTASTYLKALAARRFVDEIKVGRENLYINRRLLALLADAGVAAPLPASEGESAAASEVVASGTSRSQHQVEATL